MIKALVILLLLIPSPALALRLSSPEAGIEIETSKIASLEAPVTDESAKTFIKQMDETEFYPGARVILIDSNGGLVSAGQEMINRLEAEKALGTQIICVVEHRAHSMAFNLLTHCDVRLARPNAVMIFHKVALMFSMDLDPKSPRHTPKNLRQLADEIEKQDEDFRQPNVKALHMSFADYDRYCDQDRAWSALALLARQYLHGLATLQK